MFQLDQVVPWGRAFAEYRRMFGLTAADLQRSIVGVGDGPASFQAEAARRGIRVVSIDPLYRFTTEQIRQRINATYDQVMEQARQNASSFVWRSIPDLETLGAVRMAAMQEFLLDYDAGRSQQRYLCGELPELPVRDGQFDLALCPHLLFLYSEQLDETFHRRSIVELCRVAREVRIFPLVSLAGTPSPYVVPCIESLARAGYHATVERVDYEFQRGANQMLRIVSG